MSKRIVCISDTHGMHRSVDLPDGDFLITCGDITNRGEISVIKDFSKWLDKAPHKNKIVTFGNHELGMSKGPNRLNAIKLITDSAFYLENSSVIIDGIKFYGSPVTPSFYNWEWNLNRGPEIAANWDNIPLDVNVLITHGPPHGILDLIEDNFANSNRDLHQGCEDLMVKIPQLKQLKAHVFGHLHFNGGLTKVINNITFGNAAICNESYKPINKPLVFDI